MLKKLIIYVIIFYRIGDKIMKSQNISNNTTNNTRSTSYTNLMDWYNDFEKEKENYYKKISEINKYFYCI